MHDEEDPIRSGVPVCGASNDDDDMVPPSCDEEDPIRSGVPVCGASNDDGDKVVPPLCDEEDPIRSGVSLFDASNDDDDMVSPSCDEEDPKRKKRKEKKRKRKETKRKRKRKKTSTQPTESSDPTRSGVSLPDASNDDGDEVVPPSCDEEDPKRKRKETKRTLKTATVQRAKKKKKTGKRVWDKKDFCLYCSKPQLKLYRHCTTHHSKEKLVIEISHLEKGSQLRKTKIAALRNQGNLQHNKTVWMSGKGKIVPRKRPAFSCDAVEYLPCEICNGAFTNQSLSKHQKICAEIHGRKRTKRAQANAKMVIPTALETDEKLKATVLTRMNADKQADMVLRDPNILAFGSRLLRTHSKPHHVLPISQQMRDLAKLVLAAQSIDPTIGSIGDCIDAEKFNTLTEAVKQVAEYSDETGKYGKPSYARNIGYAVDKVVVQMRSETLKMKDTEARQQQLQRLDDFEKLKRGDWSHEVMAKAYETFQDRKCNKANLLPIAEDITKMTQHVKQRMKSCQQQLTLTPNPTTQDWNELCQSTLTHVVMFNRRRSGESERLLLKDFHIMDNSQSTDIPANMPKEVYESLGEVEKAMCQKLTRVEVVGKRGRIVPILLTKDMREAISTLNLTRDAVGVSCDNPYVFARPYFDSVFPTSTSAAMRKYSVECNATNPLTMRATKMRKHIATMTQLLCLKENELDLVAGHMGHDVRIHREFYRLPESSLQLAKVSKILVMMEKGLAGAYKGKSLDEIDISLDECKFCLITWRVHKRNTASSSFSVNKAS